MPHSDFVEHAHALVHVFKEIGLQYVVTDIVPSDRLGLSVRKGITENMIGTLDTTFKFAGWD